MRKRMKTIMMMILAVVLFAACREDEEELTPVLQVPNFYVIEDNPSDSIQHRVYEIYKKYGVPVYFNDTIGRTFVKTDIHGDSVFTYETLDLGWGFTSHTYLNYNFVYMTDPAVQSRWLDVVEEFLNRTSKNIYPFAIMLATSARSDDGRGKVEMIRYRIGFRVIFISEWWEDNEIEEVPHVLLNQLVKQKVQNYPDDIAPFSGVSNKNWYGGIPYTTLDPTIPSILPNPYEQWGLPTPLQFSVDMLDENWYGTFYFDGNYCAPEELPVLRRNVRLKVGQFGFISGHRVMGGQWTPQTTAHDLEDYISEMTTRTRAEFQELWGDCPLVMKKYNIIYDVLKNRMGVEL